MNKTLNLLGKPNKPSAFIFVWQGDNSEYFCEFIYNKDYETAEYAILQIIPKTGINNAVLYKSVVKLNNTNKQHVFRVYVPFAFYSGDKYKLTKAGNCFAPPIEIWSVDNKAWIADYVTKFDYCERLKTEIDISCKRVYGGRKNENYHDFDV
jgi:hypothetical protein